MKAFLLIIMLLAFCRTVTAQTNATNISGHHASAMQVTSDLQKADALEILNKVDTFYNGAWNRLWSVAAVIGLVIPLLFHFYQRRYFTVKSEELIKQVHSDSKAMIAKEIEVAVAAERARTLKEMEGALQEFHSKFSNLEGSILYVQGTVFRKDGNWEALAANLAAYSFAKAAVAYVKANNERRAQTMADLVKDQLALMTKDDFDEVLNQNLEAMEKAFSGINENERYTGLIQSLSDAVKTAQRRTKV